MNIKIVTNGSFISLLLSAGFMAENKEKIPRFPKVNLEEKIVFIQIENLVKKLRKINSTPTTEVFLVNVFFNKNGLYGRKTQKETLNKINSMLSKNIRVNLLVKNQEEKEEVLSGLWLNDWPLETGLEITTQDKLKAAISLKKNRKMLVDMINWLDQLDFAGKDLQRNTTANLEGIEATLKKLDERSEQKRTCFIFDLVLNSLISSNVDDYDLSDFLDKFSMAVSKGKRIKGKFPSETLKNELAKAKNSPEAEEKFKQLLNDGHTFEAILSASNWLQFERKKHRDAGIRTAIMRFFFCKLSGETRKAYEDIVYLTERSKVYKEKLEPEFLDIVQNSEKIGEVAVADLRNEQSHFNATKLIMELKKDRDIQSVVLVLSEKTMSAS